jgi:predicted porin
MHKGARWLTLTAGAMFILGMAGQAQAADLKGGGCCADLEERVAELEATTARKGNRVVSLEISGQVNKALLIWDDGDESDAFIVDPDSDGSRFRLTGKAKLKPGWEAGYTMEFNVTDAASNVVSQDNDEGASVLDGPRIRRNFLYIESERLGRFTIGQENQATDGINEIDVATTYSTVSKTHYAGNFLIGGGSTFRWQDVLGAIGGGQEDIVRYDTPTIAGFIASASWGDDDIYDVALRFSKQFNSVKIAAGIGYLVDDREDSVVDSQLSGSISAQHVPSGLFATFAAGQREFEDGRDDATNWYVKGGVSRKWLPHGDTTLWADYASFESEGFGQRVIASGAEADVWGFGVVQAFDSAALNVYALTQFYSADVDGFDTEDHFAVVIGSHIKF